MWQALSAACALLPFVAAVAVPDPSSFATLAAASAVATGGASVVFAISAPDVVAWLSLVCCKVCQRHAAAAAAGGGQAAQGKVAKNGGGFAALSTSSQHGGPATTAKQLQEGEEDDDGEFNYGDVKFTIASEEEDEDEENKVKRGFN